MDDRAREKLAEDMKIEKEALLGRQPEPKPETDPMRKEYRELSKEEWVDVIRIKAIGASFFAVCDERGPSRELSLAKTKMEEAVMWAVKGITG